MAVKALGDRRETRRKSRESSTSVGLSAVCLKEIAQRCLEQCRDHMVSPDYIVVSSFYMGLHEAPLFQDFAVRKEVQQ